MWPFALALTFVVSASAPAIGAVHHLECIVVTEDRSAPSWVGWGDGGTEAAALSAAIRAACDPAPESERALCRSRAPLGKVSASKRRGAGATTVFVEIEIYREKSRIEGLGRAWGPASPEPADTSETFRQACQRALERACALVKGRPELPSYPLAEDRGARACTGQTWQIVEHRWAGGAPDPEGARFVPDVRRSPQAAPKAPSGGPKTAPKTYPKTTAPTAGGAP